MYLIQQNQKRHFMFNNVHGIVESKCISGRLLNLYNLGNVLQIEHDFPNVVAQQLVFVL